MNSSFVLAADIGKSRCRLRLQQGTAPGSAVLGELTLPGFAGLASPEGVDQVCRMIEQGMEHFRKGGAGPRQALRALNGIGAAVAGVAASAAGARELATRLVARYGAAATVLSDATAAHLGAFGSAPGSAVIVGTGAVVFRFDSAGLLHRADGWGPLLGDRGSGRWIGQQGLSAVLQAHDGGPSTSLSEADCLPAPVQELASWLNGSENPYRAMGSFAPRVLDAAQAGDHIARDIVERAVGHISTSVLRARGADSEAGTEFRIALLGGVTESDFFRALVSARLHASGAQVVPALGSGLDGAAQATLPDLLQERYLYRER